MQVLLSKGVKEDRILFLSLVAAPEGIHKICSDFPRVKVRVPWVGAGAGRCRACRACGGTGTARQSPPLPLNHSSRASTQCHMCCRAIHSTKVWHTAYFCTLLYSFHTGDHQRD